MIPFRRHATIPNEKLLYTKTGLDAEELDKVYNDLILQAILKKYQTSMDNVLDGLQKVNTPIITKDRIEKELFNVPSKARERVYKILNITEFKKMKKIELEKLIESRVKHAQKNILDSNIIKSNISESNKIISKLYKLNEAPVGDDDMTDLAYKAYRYITDAMFIVLRNPALKKEFYKSLTDLQNTIEKFLFDYNKEQIKTIGT